MLPSSDIFTKALALLAFVVAFYALAARERKTPYLTNSLYSTAFWIFLSSLLMLVAQFIEPLNKTWGIVASISAKALLVIGAINITVSIMRIHNRHVNFRDDNLIKNLAFIRRVRNYWKAIRQSPSYEYDPPKLPQDLIEVLKESQCFTTDQLVHAGARIVGSVDERPSISAVYRVTSLAQSDERLINLAAQLLNKEWSVQYATCIRHPIEFIEKLRQSLSKTSKSDWREIVKQIVVVDAYTPHFGFTDSIHLEVTNSLKKSGVHCVTSAPSYAGIHTATAKAFNKIKEQRGGRPRIPTLIIYEGLYALVDLESIEQYRIFIRHVIPSERLWGGMFTFVIESSIRDEDLAVLRAYADIFVDESSTVNNEANSIGSVVEKNYGIRS